MDKNYLSAPLSILWDITYECNLRCKHCLVSAGERLKDELTFGEVKDIIDQLINMKVFNICFLGGEPLMRKDFLDILRYASRWSIGITFSTNGSLIDDFVIKELEDLKIFQVQVSLDGLENTHNRIRGNNSSFQDAVQAIEKLVKSGIQVGVSTTVTKLNLKELNSLIELSMDLGANYFKAIPFIPVGRGINNESLILQPQDIEKYVSILFETKKEENKKIHIYAEETYSWLLDDPPKPSIISSLNQNISCVAGNSQLVITPNGLVHPCPFLHTFIAGDLRKEKLSVIWNESKILKLFRDMKKNRLKGKCKDCPYIPIHCSGGCRAAAFNASGDFYAEDPLCWYKANNRSF
jgi:radical SAM protein with 4Fe4S-binding SPASM domain